MTRGKERGNHSSPDAQIAMQRSVKFDGETILTQTGRWRQRRTIACQATERELPGVILKVVSRVCGDIGLSEPGQGVMKARSCALGTMSDSSSSNHDRVSQKPQAVS